MNGHEGGIIASGQTSSDIPVPKENKVKRTTVWAAILLMLCACVRPVLAMGLVEIVTKETQVKMGLDFTLTAERASPTAVLVRMEIPDKGNLRNLQQVALYIGTGTGSPQIYAPLQTTAGKDGARMVSFQLSPELADRCSIALGPTVLSRPTLSHHYYVQLKGYLTDRK